MQRVLRDLGQHTPIKHLDWSAETWIWIQQNQDIVAELLKESTLEYFKYICKGLNEPDDVIYDSLGYMPHSLSHVIKKYYLPLDLEPIYIKEDVAFISNGTTGLRTWQASLLMLEYLTENVQLIKGKSILEIGAGCGLIGIAAKKLGAAAVVMTDVAELVIERIHDNIALNPSITSVNSVKYLDWQEPILIECDALIASDVIFDPGLIPILVNVLSLYRNRLILVSQTIRNQDTMLIFLRELQTSGLAWQEINFGPRNYYYDEGGQIQILKIYAAQ